MSEYKRKPTYIQALKLQSALSITDCHGVTHNIPQGSYLVIEGSEISHYSPREFDALYEKIDPCECCHYKLNHCWHRHCRYPYTYPYTTITWTDNSTTVSDTVCGSTGSTSYTLSSSPPEFVKTKYSANGEHLYRRKK